MTVIAARQGSAERAWNSARLAGLAGLVVGGIILGPLALKFARISEDKGLACSFGKAAGIGAICTGIVQMFLFIAFLAS